MDTRQEYHEGLCFAPLTEALMSTEGRQQGVEMSKRMETGRPPKPSLLSTHPIDPPTPGLPRAQLMIINGKGSPI